MDELVSAVQSAANTATIQPDLVRRIGAQELAKGRSFKEAVKETRNKLHQVGGAYQETALDYARLRANCELLPGDLADPRVDAILPASHGLPCLHPRTAAGHLTNFIKDLASGSARCTRCWTWPAASIRWPCPGCRWRLRQNTTACDIYADLVDFLNDFFAHLGMNGQAGMCDLTAAVPAQPAQVALLLKTLPCLEQLDKTIGPRLLEGIDAEHVLVSFPARSLGGRRKAWSELHRAILKSCWLENPGAQKAGKLDTELVFWLAR